MHMALGQGHGRVEADDGELVGDMQDGLDHRFPHLGFEVVKLSGVVPGHGCAIVAVVDVAGVAGPMVDALEHHGRVGVVVVVVF